MSRDETRFWETAKDWSRRKHLILSYYLKPAAAKLRRASPDGRVVILDGFAGRGEYGDDLPGSPIHMGQLADACQAWKDPVNLKIYNVEPDAASFRDLVSCTQRWADKGTIRNLEGTFQQWLPFVQKEAGRSPLFAFLDPFRPSHLLFDDFTPLLTRAAKTEICFVFHTPSVIRMIRAAAPQARTAEQIKHRLSERLDQVFGSHEWKVLLSQTSPSAEDVVQCFVQELMARGSRGNTFVCHKAIEARFTVGLKYHIVFFTRHPDGVRLMNDAFCRETEAAFAISSQTEQLKLSFDEHIQPVEMTEDSRLSVLCAMMFEVLQKNPEKVWKRADLVFAGICARFGEFLESEHRRSIGQLLHRSSAPRLRALDGHLTKTGRWRTNDTTSLVFEP